jgi:hypothetical protein
LTRGRNVRDAEMVRGRRLGRILVTERTPAEAEADLHA